MGESDQLRLRKRGITLATALLLGAIALTLALSLAGVSFTHLNVTARLDNLQRADNLAEATLSEAISRILYSEGEFGTKGTADDKTIIVTFPNDPPGAKGILTFDKGKARQLQVPYSTHNLKNQDSSVSGYNRQVPPESVHLIAQGECNGVVRRVEAVLAIPTYRYAIATTGKFISPGGGMEVQGVEDPSALADGVISPKESMPGHIASNSTAAEAVKLVAPKGAKVLITGDVKTRGQVTTQGDVTVNGSLLEHADPAEIPQVDPKSYDPGDNAVPVGSVQGDLRVGGANVALRNSGPLMTAKSITLEDGFLYVDGDLTVQNGIKGTGIIVTSGDLTLLGEGSLETDKAVAIVAGGDITIRGNGKKGSYFQGIVYSGGNKIDIKDVTLVGSLIGRGDHTKVVARNARIVPSQQKVLQMDWFFNVQGGKRGPPEAFNVGTASGVGSGAQNTVSIWDPDKQLGSQIRLNPNLWLPRTGKVRQLYPKVDDVGPLWVPKDKPIWTTWYDKSSQDFIPYVVYHKDKIFPGNIDIDSATTPIDPDVIINTTSDVPPPSEKRPAIYFKNDSIGWVIRYDFNHDGNPDETPLMEYIRTIRSNTMLPPWSTTIVDRTNFRKEQWDKQWKANFLEKISFEEFELEQFLLCQPNASHSFLKARLNLAKKLLQQDESIIKKGSIHFDPNKFIQLSKKTKVVLWRHI